MKKIFLTALLCVSFALTQAQNADFPLMFSQYGMNGTANYLGKAGAIGALGGDIMSANYNPAGLGLYRTSELTLSMGLDYNSTKSISGDVTAKDSYPAFNYGNLGLVLAFNVPKKSDWKVIQLSFGLNRLMNFNNRIKASRKNLNRSYIDANYVNFFDRDMDGVLDAPYEITGDDYNVMKEEDFFRSGVIGVESDYSLTSDFFNGSFDQIIGLRESGYLNEFTMSLSGNFKNMLYLGATIGVPFGSYTSKYLFSESVTNASVSGLKYNYNTEQNLSVTGLNLKLGAIIKPVSFFRIGGAIHTPTFYSVDDDFYQEVSYTRTSGGWFNPITYRMQSPWRFIGSGAFVLGSSKSKVSGTLSFDYEYADYSSMSFDLENNIDAENSLNTDLENSFTGANTIRVGAEIKLERLYLRAGYANYGSPFKNTDLHGGDWNYVTFGVGYKGNSCFFDLAYVYGKQKSYYYPYSEYELDNNNIGHYYLTSSTEVNRSKNLIQATIGFRF
ncbi:MAG: hypothetical protein IJ748_01350 [Bacteroidales bacterium]|nr:hypothetical protein [Bacteroidales bacterium]